MAHRDAQPEHATRPKRSAHADAVAGALLGTAVGDAFGAAAEGAPSTTIAAAQRALEQRRQHAPLAWTDDTELAWILAETLAQGVATAGRTAPDALDEDALVGRIAARADLRRGYGGGMIALVQRWRAGQPWREATTAVFPDGSFGNGGAMRVAPLGAACAFDPGAGTELARRQAAITHAHPLGQDGAVVQARAVGLATARGRFGRDELAALVEVPATAELHAALADALRLADQVHGEADDAVLAEAVARLGAEVVAWRSVPLALWIAAVTGSVPRAVTLAVAAGGDADTIGAMAAAVRGAADGASAIPQEWIDAVEDGPHLAGHARELADALTG